MCNETIRQLAWLLCKYRCSPAKLASSLTFFPPDPPFYELVKGEDGEMQSIFDATVCAVDCTNFEAVKLTTRRGNVIAAFLYRHPDAKWTLLSSHGNATDCGMMRTQYIRWCKLFKINVFAYDYSGYGASTGTPSEANTYADIEAAYDYLIEKKIVESNRVILYGQSVGSGPSIKLATCKDRPIGGLVLHSPLMSGIRVLSENRGCLACFDIYPNIDRIPNVRCPVLVIHGTMDEEVDIYHGFRIHEAVPKKLQTTPCFIDGAGHNDIAELFASQYYPKLGEFLATIMNGSSSKEEDKAGDATDNVAQT